MAFVNNFSWAPSCTVGFDHMETLWDRHVHDVCVCLYNFVYIVLFVGIFFLYIYYYIVHITICIYLLVYLIIIYIIYILLYCTHLHYIALYIVLMYVVLYYLVVCIVIILENLGRMMNHVFFWHPISGKQMEKMVFNKSRVIEAISCRRYSQETWT